MPKFEVIQGGLDDGPLKQKRKVIEESIIKEERVFDKKEVMDLIEDIAAQEGINKDQLEIERETYTTSGELVHLVVKVISGRAKGEGWGAIIYSYMIKGDHKGIRGGSLETMITRVYATVDDPDTEAAGGIVGRYKNGEWELSPGKMAKTPTDISL